MYSRKKTENAKNVQKSNKNIFNNLHVKFFKILDFIANIQINTIHNTQPIISLRAKLKRNFFFRKPGIKASFMSFLSFALCYINTACDKNITNDVYFIIYL